MELDAFPRYEQLRAATCQCPVTPRRQVRTLELPNSYAVGVATMTMTTKLYMPDNENDVKYGARGRETMGEDDRK